MGSTLANRLDGVHPQMLRAEGEGDRKKVAEHRERVGRLVERALILTGLTKQQAAYEMGYSDSGVVSRWCSGAERPLLDRLFLVSGFEDSWLIAQAEGNPRAEVERTIKLRSIA